VTSCFETGLLAPEDADPPLVDAGAVAHVGQFRDLRPFVGVAGTVSLRTCPAQPCGGSVAAADAIKPTIGLHRTTPRLPAGSD
jgi:hypothetical protein